MRTLNMKKSQPEIISLEAYNLSPQIFLVCMLVLFGTQRYSPDTFNREVLEYLL